MKHTYKKKPVIVDAIQFKSGMLKPIFEFVDSFGDKFDEIFDIAIDNENKHEPEIKVKTLEGTSYAMQDGAMLIRGVKGEYYPCRYDIFQETYEKYDKETDGISFGCAIDALKNGKKVAREGWNGKNMYLYYVPAADYKAMTDIARAEFGNSVPYGAYIAMKTAQSNVVPWLASQTDVLSNDWVII